MICLKLEKSKKVFKHIKVGKKKKKIKKIKRAIMIQHTLAERKAGKYFKAHVTTSNCQPEREMTSTVIYSSNVRKYSRKI